MGTHPFVGSGGLQGVGTLAKGKEGGGLLVDLKVVVIRKLRQRRRKRSGKKLERTEREG